jgi:hypothetical protein
MTKAFLSFTIEREGRTIQVNANIAGIDKLIEALQDVKKQGHLHLWDTSIGGIQSEKDPWGNTAVCDVSMTAGGDEDIA